AALMDLPIASLDFVEVVQDVALARPPAAELADDAARRGLPDGGVHADQLTLLLAQERVIPEVGPGRGFGERLDVGPTGSEQVGPHPAAPLRGVVEDHAPWPVVAVQ